MRFEIGTALIAANCPGDKKPHLDACRAEFIQKITDRVPSWENSSQLRALRAMTKPSEDASLRYMRLEPGKINEFQEARNAGAVLPPPGGVEDWLARPPRGAQAAPAPARPANALFRKGDKVRDIEMGDFGVVAEDQTAPGADVLVDFDGTQDSMPAAGLERR